MLGGKPVIKDTRMPVWLLLQEASFGRTVEEIVAAYPTITPDDVRAAFAWAADQVAEAPREAA